MSLSASRRFFGTRSVPSIQLTPNATPASSLVQVRLEPGQRILVQPGSLLSVSSMPLVRIEWVLAFNQSVLPGLYRAILKRTPFLMQQVSLTSTDSPCDLVLTPNASNVTILPLDGRTSFTLSTSNILSISDGIHLTSPVRSSDLNGVSLSGVGWIALKQPGECVKLALKKDEEYYVQARHVVAWQSHMMPQFTVPSTESSLNPSETPLKMWMRAYWNAQFHRSLDVLKRRLTGAVLRNENAMVRLEGPGEIYLSTQTSLPGAGLLSFYMGLRQVGDAIRQFRNVNEHGAVSEFKPVQYPIPVKETHVVIEKGKVKFEEKKEEEVIEEPKEKQQSQNQEKKWFAWKK